MKHINYFKVFENSQEEFKNFFKDKINWNFLSYLSNCCLQYIDDEKNYIKIGVVSNIDNINMPSWIYDYNESYWVNYEQREFDRIMTWYNFYSIEDINKPVLGSKNNIYYRLISGNIDNKINSKDTTVLNKIVERIKKSNKYKVNLIYPVTGYKNVVDFELI